MNYKKSTKILKKICKAKKIVVNCHKGPDPDSIGSALSASYILKKLGKRVEIVCPSASLDERMHFLPGYADILTAFDFDSLEKKECDLLLALDSASWDMVSGKEEKPKNLEVIAIDHHLTNTKYAKTNLVDKEASSVGEMLYKVFQDWRVKIDKSTATALLAAIIGDTGIFKYTNTTPVTLKIAGELIELGAEKDKIIYSLFRSIDVSTFNFAGHVLKILEVDRKHRFVWASMDYETFEKLGKPDGAKDFVVSIFAQSAENTDFGIFVLEKQKGIYSISLRARKDGLDVSKMAVDLGGGGHAAAAGGGSALQDLDFNKAVDKVLDIARKFSKQNKKA